MFVDRRVQRPRVGHGKAVVRIGHGAQALLQLVALATLRSGPPHWLRATTAADDAAPSAATTDATDTADIASTDDATAAAAAVHRWRRRTTKRKLTGGRRFGNESWRQAHAVYLNQCFYL